MFNSDVIVQLFKLQVRNMRYIERNNGCIVSPESEESTPEVGFESMEEEIEKDGEEDDIDILEPENIAFVLEQEVLLPMDESWVTCLPTSPSETLVSP